MKGLFRLLLVFASFWSTSLFAQTDTSFWFAAPDVSQLHGDRPVVFRFATFEKSANVRITLPATNTLVAELNIPPNSESSYVVSAPDFLEIKAGFIQKNGIHIQSSAKITAYYEVVGKINNTDIYALKGNYALGKDFVVPMQNLYQNQYDLEAYSSVQVVATEDNTKISFIPSAELYVPRFEDTVRITLNKGETYSFRALTEEVSNKLSGSVLFSDKPVAVSVTDDSALDGSNWDLIGDQLIPFNYGGTKYVLPKGLIAVTSKNEMTFTVDSKKITLDKSNHFSVSFMNSKAALFEFPDTVIINFIDLYQSFAGAELGGAIIPPITCSGSREVSFVRSSSRPFFLYLVFRTSSQDAFLLNNNFLELDENLIEKLDSNLSYIKMDFEEDLIATNRANRIKNTEAPFHLAISNGSESTGFQLGYFSNFRNEIQDTIYVCTPFKSGEEFTSSLNLYGSVKLDTIKADNQDSLYIKFKVIDEYCVFEDSAIVIQAKAPLLAISDSIVLCSNVDSVITFNEYKVIFDEFLVQKSIALTKDSLTVYLENKEGCFAQKKVRIKYLDSLQVSFPKDTNFCVGEVLTRAIEGNYTSLQINNILRTDSIFLVDSTSTILIEVENQCGTKKQALSFTALELPVIDLGKDRTLCGKNLSIKLPINYTYLWQDNLKTSNYKIYKSGLHHVTAKDTNNCVFTDSVLLNYKPIDSIPKINNSKICPGSVAEIHLKKGHDQYLWNDGINGSDRNFGVGTYSVNISTSANDSLCYQTSFSFEITAWNLEIPNVITPNNDTKNETFKIIGLDASYPLKFDVYNRWGAQIFGSLDYQNDFGGTDLSSGVYFYEMSSGEYKCVHQKGYITVIK